MGVNRLLDLSMILSFLIVAVSYHNRANAQEQYMAISGVQGSIQPRREIRDLYTDAAQWNVFILGLARFQAMEPSDPMSYYQVAGELRRSGALTTILTRSRHPWCIVGRMG